MQQGIKINQFVIGGCTIIVVLTGLASYLANSTNNSLIESNKWVSHTYAVKAELKEMEKTLVDAETGQRGFIITNKTQYLEPFNKAKIVMEKKFALLWRNLRKQSA